MGSSGGDGRVLHHPVGEGSDSCVRAAAHVGLRALLGEGTGARSNFAFSPLSLRAALGLIAVGSSGRTLDQVLSFLGLSNVDGINDVRLAAGDVIASLPNRAGCGKGARTTHIPSVTEAAPTTHTSFVSGVWLDQTLTFNEAFEEVARGIHRAETKVVDFVSKASEVIRDINGWVEKETNGIIKDFLPEDAMNSDTQLVVANALFFNGAWASPFDSSLTFDSEFHLLGGGSVRAPFMTIDSGDHQTISCFDGGLKVLRLPYKIEPGYPVLTHRHFCMYVFLPRERDGLRRLTEEVASDPSFLRRHLPQDDVEVGTFMLPRFETSWGTFDVSNTLRDLGLPLLFSREGQLDRLAFKESFRGQYKLCLSAVFHKAAVKVDEEGTEAAAATGESDMGCSMFEDPDPVVDFVADHPFLFVIMEEDSELVVFYGHVVNPLGDGN